MVLLAADIEVPAARFAGKRIYRCGTGIALKQARATLDKALAEGRWKLPVLRPARGKRRRKPVCTSTC